ncbi:MAG: hypothetical protein L3J36_12770 [Rhodobacteraceae bacterium]|nr:hypothetical protein [Paracoccaceae bacterium]
MEKNQDIQITFDHSTAVAFRWLKTSYWRQVWLRAAAEAGARPIVIYGGGRHTVKFIRFIQKLEAGPTVRAILDDMPSCEDIGGFPVVKPSEIDPKDISLVLISSDWIEDTLAIRANEWSGGKAPVIRMYEQVPTQVLHALDNAGEIVPFQPGFQCPKSCLVIAELVLSRLRSGLFRAMFAMKEIRNGNGLHRRVSP